MLFFIQWIIPLTFAYLHIQRILYLIFQEFFSLIFLFILSKRNESFQANLSVLLKKQRYLFFDDR